MFRLLNFFSFRFQKFTSFIMIVQLMVYTLKSNDALSFIKTKITTVFNITMKIIIIIKRQKSKEREIKKN
jgi:hypothetical protein